MADTPTKIDLEAYLKRIEFSGPVAPSIDCLTALHEAHRVHIPFENLDIQLGRPIRLDLDSVFGKLVGNCRGGYCFEQNALFAAVLEEIGFQVTRLAARVRSGTTRVLPRTHMFLSVETGGSSWLADVGFGGLGLLHPIPIVMEKVNQQFAWKFRIMPEGELSILQRFMNEAWEDLYAFTREPQLPADYELANYYTSTHPESRFVLTTTAQRATPEAIYILRNREFITMRGEQEETIVIDDDEELLRILREKIGLSFPPGTRFRSLMQTAAGIA